MNIKSNKGLTMIVLIITVIMLIILGGAMVSIGINVAGEAQFENVQTYLLLIQSKCEKLANDKVIGEIDDAGLYGEKQEGSDWYKLSQGDLNDILGEKKAKAEDGYYVNYDTNEVKYEKGVEHNGEMLYYLSDMISYSED